MNEDLQKRILRAKDLIVTSRYAAMATVNEDGSPHNTPFRFLHDQKLEYIYWGSHPESLHSLNVTRTGKIFVVLYDRLERGGLYIKGEEAHELTGEELEEALAIHNAARLEEGAQPLDINYYTEDSAQRMWRSKVTKLWVNGVERDSDGHVIKDNRIEIRAEELI